MGVNFGSRVQKQAVELNEALIVEGLQDAFGSAKPLLTAAEVKAALAELQSEYRARRTQTVTQLRERNGKEGEAFLAENKTREGVVTLPSGLQYRVLEAGDGKKPTAGDTVVCHYRGTLIDGKEFDSSHKRGKAATFAVKRVIKGWSEALQLMPEGSTWQLVIPPDLAYGVRGTRGIGPNATLVFEVELLSIKDSSRARQRPEPSRHEVAKKEQPSP